MALSNYIGRASGKYGARFSKDNAMPKTTYKRFGNDIDASTDKHSRYFYTILRGH